jgi:ABC-2 type transport system ATP-binding protein
VFVSSHLMSEMEHAADQLIVTGLSADRISELAFRRRIQLRELTTHATSLEDAFMQLTADSVEYQAGQHR